MVSTSTPILFAGKQSVQVQFFAQVKLGWDESWVWKIRDAKNGIEIYRLYIYIIYINMYWILLGYYIISYLSPTTECPSARYNFRWTEEGFEVMSGNLDSSNQILRHQSSTRDLKNFDSAWVDEKSIVLRHWDLLQWGIFVGSPHVLLGRMAAGPKGL